VTGYDLVSLLVGSEGTLALTTRAVLRLVPKPEAVRTVLALFDDALGAGRAVSAVFKAGILPRCAELLDRRTLELVRSKDPSIDRRGAAMLIIELDGDELACDRAMERVGAACDASGAITVLVAQDATRRDSLWSARRALSTTTRAMAKFKVSEDVVVPRRHIASLLDELERMRDAEARASAERADGPRGVIELLAYGHAGDGNLHVNFLWNHVEAAERVERLLGQLFRKVIELGGTLTGEHGVGLSKAPYLRLEQSDATISLQQRIKSVFDPKRLLNPGKIFAPHGHGVC
jgi:glycolate oxidase